MNWYDICFNKIRNEILGGKNNDNRSTKRSKKQ